MKKFLVFFIFIFAALNNYAQCLNISPKTYNLACGINCTNFSFKVPQIKTTENYLLGSTSYNPFAYTTPAGMEDFSLYEDDKYSSVVNLPFKFCFYGANYDKIIVGSNGLITFDIANAGCINAYNISQQIPYAGGTQCATGGATAGAIAYYPKASIMGGYADIDPTANTNTAPSPPDRKIEWREEGTAPCRKFIISYYNIGTYGSVNGSYSATGTNCNSVNLNTFQIVIYEANNFIDVYIKNKVCTPSTNGGKSILGIQNWDRNLALAAPGKNSTVWTASNEGYRFKPNGNTSLLQDIVISKKDGTFVGNGVIGVTANDSTSISYPNYCVSGSGPDTLVVKANYNSCTGNAADAFTLIDTIYVIKNPGDLLATATTTPATCTSATGSITVTVPAGAGTPPYQYSINGGALQTSNVFTGLAPNTYTIFVKDAGGTCTSTISVTVGQTNPVTVTGVPVSTSCSGVNNGSITVTAVNATPPIQYKINGGAYQLSNVFTNLGASFYTVEILDGNGCTATTFVNLLNGPGVSATIVPTAATCAGINNGSITITNPTGTAPHLYEIDGGGFQGNNVFTGLSAGNHLIKIKDANGCINTNNITVGVGSGITAAVAQTPVSCAGAVNGVITITNPTGNAPHQYLVDAGAYQAGNIFTGLTAGSHIVKVKDNNGCIYTTSITITIGTGITATVSQTPATCAGVNNGVVTVTSPTGTAPHTYEIDGGGFQGSNSFSGLAAGSHTVKVKDNFGCLYTTTITVTTGAGITASVSQTPATCVGVSNGIITVTSPTGTAPHTYEVDGGGFQGSSSFTGLAAGSHTVKVKDNNGCIYTTTITITTGAGITATVNQTPTACTGVNTGIVTVTNPTGTAPHTYEIDGGGFQSNSIFNGLAAGSHTVKVKDNNGCIYTTSITITTGTGITATVTPTPTACTGVSTGTITVTNPTGNAPHTYEIDGGGFQSNSSFTSLAAGPHTVNVKDNNGCIYTTSVTITVGTGITATVTPTPTACTGVSNGIITVTNPTGNAPHTYEIDGGGFQSNSSFTSLAAGPHTVKVKDNNGCIYTTSVTITVGTGITATVNQTPTACTGVNTGTITVTNPTGNAPHTYEIDGGGFQGSSSFTALAAGLHTIKVKDNNGCIYTTTITVATGAGIAATATSTATACTGINNGTITVSVTVGNAPYTYSLDGGAPQLGANFSNVSAGAHTVLVTDNVGCTKSISITVAAGVGFTLNETSTVATCATAINGTITITATGAASPINYVLDGIINQTNGVFINVGSGPHLVTVTDNNGCTNAINVTVGIGSGITATAAATATSCNGAMNGSITATPTSGTAPYQYQLNSGIFQGNATFSGLAGGNYNITVKDVNGCTVTVSTTIVQGANLAATSVINNVLCNGGNTGKITVTNTNGNTPYQYAINGGAFQGSNVFNNLIAGTYTIDLKDANGCTGSITATVTEPSLLVNNVANTAVLCNGQSTGIITLTASGGTTPYQYSINGATYQTGNTFSVPAGTYTLYCKDANGCIKTANTTVIEPTLLTLSGTTSNASCNGGADGILTLTAGGGVAPYTYSLDGINYQNSNIFNVLQGNYTVTVKDVNSCTKTWSGTVGLTSNILLSTRQDTTLCQSKSVVLTTVSNATNFSWSPGISLNDSILKNPMATPPVTTQYIVTATLGSCFIKDTVIVTVNPAPIPDAGPGTTICFGQTYQLQGGGGVQYTWTPASTLSNATIPNPVATPTANTIYALQVVDANGCTSLTPDTVLVVVTPPIQASAGPDTTIVMGQPYQLNATGGSLYLWSPAFGLSNSTIANPIATIFGEQIYNVEVSTPQGCKGNASVRLKVYAGPEIYVPTGFTPNGDGNNDVFRVITVGIKQFDYLRIFNRWGQLVFETKTARNGWSGLFKASEQPGGTYIYNVQGTTDAGRVINKKGTFILIR
jgi:gliding motility-associated-like protein